VDTFVGPSTVCRPSQGPCDVTLLLVELVVIFVLTVTLSICSLRSVAMAAAAIVLGMAYDLAQPYVERKMALATCQSIVPVATLYVRAIRSSYWELYVAQRMQQTTAISKTFATAFNAIVPSTATSRSAAPATMVISKHNRTNATPVVNVLACLHATIVTIVTISTFALK
jgi:hypothetical protein